MRTLFTLCLLTFSMSIVLAQKSKVEYGFASVYSDEYQGSYTASGASYDRLKNTAAHKSFPFGTILQVINMDNNRSVMVKVTDRGPFIKGYVIDLSGAAADALRIKNGKANVKLIVEKIPRYIEDSEIKEDHESQIATDNEEDTRPEEYDTSVEIKKEDTSNTKETSKEASKKTEIAPEGDLTEKGGEIPFPKNDELKSLSSKDYHTFDLYKASTFDPKAMGYGVQIGTYHQLHNVLKTVAQLQENWFSNIMLTREVEGDKTTYKVIIGPFDERTAADTYKKNASKKGVKGFVVAVQPLENLEVYQVKAIRPKKEGYAVQIMSLTDADNVIQEVDKLRKKWFKNILIHVVKGKDNEPEYKILLGPLPDKKTADSYKNALGKKKMNGFVVDLSISK